MAGDAHGAETQEEPQAQEDLGHEQAQEEQPQVSDADWEKAIAERNEKIAALEQQVADAAKNAESAEALRGEIAELKAQGESTSTISASCNPMRRITPGACPVPLAVAPRSLP